jgi:hypothetical protein
LLGVYGCICDGKLSCFVPTDSVTLMGWTGQVQFSGGIA